MAKQKTTVLFIDSNHRIRKPFLIPTFFIKNWLLLSCILLLSVGISVYSAVSYGKQVIAQQEAALEAVKRSYLEEAQALKSKKEHISQQIEAVNSLLLTKGINPVIPPTQEKDAGFELTANEVDSDPLQKKIEEFKYVLAQTPIGFPLEGRLSSRFGHRANPFTGQHIESHSGLDIKGDYGDPVKTTADGIVSFAGVQSGYGNLVIIDHGDNYQTYYGHLSSILVKNGQQVQTNELIGKVGATGRATGTHLHYEIRENKRILNPENFLVLN